MMKQMMIKQMMINNKKKDEKQSDITDIPDLEIEESAEQRRN